MSNDRVERRLAAVLAADVAGYSRLMGRDEEGTHAKLTSLLDEAIYPAIVEHRGRIVKNALMVAEHLGENGRPVVRQHKNIVA